MPSDFLTPRRLTAATDAYDQEQAAVSEVNQRAAEEDVVGQQMAAQKAYIKQNEAAQANAARIQREQESAQRKQATQQRELLGRQKKAGIKTKFDDAGREQVVTHENGAPVYEHGFQGDPEATPDGKGHVVKYRTPQGQVYNVPTAAIRSNQDEAGAPLYEFDLPQEDGTKKTVRQPVGSKPLFSIDPKTGMRYTGAPDPVTGSVGTTPIGYDPTARSKAVLEQEKLKFAQQQEASKFQADVINLAQNAKETNLAPLKKQLTEAAAAAKKLAKEKIQYRNDAEKGLVQVVDYGSGPNDVPVPSTDPAAVSKAQAWLDKKAAADKTLADLKATHDPLAAEVLTMQQQRDALAIQHLKSSHETQVQLKRMEEAHKAGIPVYQPDWQKRFDAAQTDPRITAINTQSDLDESGGGPLAEDVRRARLPETGKLVNRLIESAFKQRPEFDIYGNSTAATPPMQRPELTMANVIGQELTADNVAPKGSDVRKLTESALGISDPENWQIKPTEGALGQMGYHDLAHKGQPIGSLNTRDSRIELLPPDSAGMDAQQQRLINTNRDGLPIYFASATPPLPAPAVKGLIQQGLEIGRSTPDQGEAEAKLAAAQLAPADLREKVLSGQLSVQDGRLLNETFYGVKDAVVTKETAAQGFQKWLADPQTGAVNGAQFRNGDDAVKREVVNRYFDDLAANTSASIIRPNRSSLADARQEMLKPFAGPNFLWSGMSAGQLSKQTIGMIPPLIGRGIYGLSGASTLAKWAGLETEADRLSWEKASDENKRRSGFAHRMWVNSDVKSSLEGLKSWAEQAEAGQEPPPEVVQKIKDAYHNEFHRLDPESDKNLGNTPDTFDITKDPMLKGLVQRYLTTSDPNTFESMHSILAMDAKSRETQKADMAYNDRPVVTTTDEVVKRGKGIDLDITPAKAGELMVLGKELDGTTDPTKAGNILKRAAGMLNLSPQNAHLALGLLTRTENEDPNSPSSIARAGWSSSLNEAAVEVLSIGLEAGIGIALSPMTAGGSLAAAGASKGVRMGVKTALKTAYRRTIGAAIGAGMKRSATFASAATRFNRARLATGEALSKAGSAYARAGIVTPTFGSPLTKLQKTRNIVVTAGKTAAAEMPMEAGEEVVGATGGSDPTLASMGKAAAGGAFGALILSPFFAAGGSAKRGFDAMRSAGDFAKLKTDWAKDINQKMSKHPGFTPYTPEDYNTVMGLAGNPAQQAAITDHESAIAELNDATAEHTASVMEIQDAAAGNAVADVPPSPRLLAAQAGAEATAANVEGLAQMAFSATDELRALPEDERALYTGAAKAVSGARDYTQAEAKALMGLGGDSAIAFQQAETVPADVAGPTRTKTLMGAPVVAPTGLGTYRLPEGVRIQVPPQAIAALKQRAPSLVGLIGSAEQTAAAQATQSAQTPTPAQPQAQGNVTTQPTSDAEQAAPLTPAVEKRLKQHGATVSYTPEEQAEVNQKWGPQSPFNTPPAFAKDAKKLPSDTPMDDSPIAEDEVLSAVQNVVEKEVRKRNTIAGRPLVVPSFYQSFDGGADYNYGNDTVRVNPLRLARSIWADKSSNPTRAEVARAVELVIDHEIVHAAQMQAAKDTFAKLPAEQQAQGFMPWVAEHYGAMWRDDLKDVHEATLKVYGSILEGRPDWHKAFEALRMIVQDRVNGSTSEAATFLTDRIKEHLKAALAVLKRWYADVMAGVADKPAIKAEIEAIEALLREPVKNNSPGNEPAQAASTGAVSTSGTSSTSPVKGSTETVASTDGITSITNKKQSSLNLAVQIPLGKGGAKLDAKFPNAESLAAFQFQDIIDSATKGKTPEEREAARQRGVSMLAAMMKDSPLSESALIAKLQDYRNSVIEQANNANPLKVFAPPPFHAFDKIETKAKVLPAPEGGDIISTLKQEGVNRIGPPAATPEWDWYNELARDAAASKLTNREAQRLARAGDITDPKAKLAWINANVVSTTGGRSIDEAAEDITASGEELGRAILDALDARQKAAGQPSATADETARAAQEKEGQTSFETFAAGSEGTPTTAGDLSRTVEPEWEVNIGGEWMAVVEADPIDESVTLENARFGSVTISGDQVVNITGEPQPPLGGASHPPISHIMPDGYALTKEGMQTLKSAPTRAYHGTPHKVDKFSLDKIGTGEGAQAYGWGLYFAGNKAVAQQYQKGLTERDFIGKIREEFSEHDDQETALNVIHGLDLSGGQRALIDALAKEDWWGFDFPHQAVQAAIREPENFDPSPEVLAALDKFGQLYTVDLLPPEEDFLDWDLPLSQQGEKVKKALESEFGKLVQWDMTAAEWHKWMTDPKHAETDAKSFSIDAAKAGIPGIRYFDGGSRFKMQQTSHAWEVLNGAGKLVAKEPTEAAARAAMEKLQTRNYVLFDDNLVRIIAENGKPVESLASAPSRYQSPASMLAATQAQMQGAEGEKPAGLQSMFNPKEGRPATGERSLFEMPKPAAPAITPRAMIDAYRAAKIGKSSEMVPIRDVYAEAYHNDSKLDPEGFMRQVSAMDASGKALIGLAESTGAVNAAQPFVHGAAGVEMAFPPELVQSAAILTNLDKVKAVRKLHPNEQAAYDKAGQMLQATQTLASAPSRVTPEQDAEYIQAVKEGDVVKQQAMVDAAAKASGYTTGPVWHGTNASFDIPAGSMLDIAAHATLDQSAASMFAREKSEEDGGKPHVLRWFLRGKFFNPSSPADVQTVERGGVSKDILTRAYWEQMEQSDVIMALKKKGFDGYYERESDDPTRKPDSIAIFDPKQIKSADPVTRDASGEIIPLSQRFNADSDSILYSAPTESAPPTAQPDNESQVREILDSMPKVWSDILRDHSSGKNVAEIAAARHLKPEQTAYILSQAQGRFDYLRGQLSTKPKVAPQANGDPLYKGGNPDLALSGIPAFAAVDQNRMTPEEVTHAEMQDAATRMFAVDRDAAEKLITRWMDSGGMAFTADDMPEGIKAIVADAQSRKASMALMTAAAQIFTVESAFAGGNSAKIARMIDLYRNSGEEIARALSQRRDPFESPAERNAWYLQNVLLVPPPSIRQQMKKNPGNKDKILAEWAARADKIKAEMLADGIDIDATFKQMARERELAAATIPEAIKAPLATAPKSTRQAVKAILEGGSWQDALNASGLDLKAAQKAYNAFRGGLRGFLGKAADAIRNTLGSAPNESESMLPEWTDDAKLTERPVQNAATQALAIQRNRKMAEGEIDLKNPLSVNRARMSAGMRKASGFDKLMEYWKASILSGPLTAVVNVSSGLGYGAYEAIFKTLSAATMADIARLFGFKPDAPSLKDLPSVFRAVIPSLQEAGKNMIAAWNTESSLFDGYATEGGLFAGQHNFKDQFDPAIKGTFGKVMRSISFRHMGAADEFVKSFFTRIEVAAQAQQIARNEGKTGTALDKAMTELMRPGSLAWERALAGAKRITFQNQEVDGKTLDSDRGTGHAAIDVLDNMADLVQRAKSGDFGSTVKVISSFLFPFVSTPSNIFKTGITMSPAGGLLALLDGARAIDRMRKGNKEEAAKIYNAARAFDDITNQIVCWSFILGMSALVKPGDGEDELPYITGSGGLGDASSGERELIQRAAPPYSIRIGDKWYSYKRLDPFGSALAFCVDAIREFQSGKSIDKVWAKIGTGMLATMQDKTFMKSISDLANVMRDPERYGTRWIAGIGTGFVPNLIRQPLRATDPVFRETDFPNDMSFTESFARRVGFGMYPSPNSPIAPLPAIDAFGREAAKNTGTGQPGSDIALRLISPVETRDFAGVDPLDVKMLRYNMAHDKGFNFTAPDRDIQRTSNGKTIKISLDDAEYLEYEKRSGQGFYTAMKTLYGNLDRDFTEADHAEISRMHSRVMEPYGNEVFGKALQKRIAEGKIKL